MQGPARHCGTRIWRNRSPYTTLGQAVQRATTRKGFPSWQATRQQAVVFQESRRPWTPGRRRRCLGYYKANTFHTPFPLGDVRVAFYKRDTFADEREFRFVFDTGTTGTDAIKLNIGDIRDTGFNQSDMWSS